MLLSGNINLQQVLFLTPKQMFAPGSGSGAREKGASERDWEPDVAMIRFKCVDWSRAAIICDPYNITSASTLLH